MKKIFMPLLAAAVFVLYGCGSMPAARPAPKRAQAPVEIAPCVPAAGLAPGSALSPVLDGARTAAVNGLLSRIAACRPLPFIQDGVVFGNREGRLPAMPSGYYKEYTLVIPGRKIGDARMQVSVGTRTFTTGEILSARGPERLVIGAGKDIYYTPDHYENFARLSIVP
jgi:ribonuclease T1